MTGGGMLTNPMAPVSFIVPKETPASTQDSAASGSLIVSGAKLYFMGASAWELVSSA